MKYYAEYVRDGECCEVVMNDKEYEEMCREAEAGYIEILHEGIFKDEVYDNKNSDHQVFITHAILSSKESS